MPGSRTYITCILKFSMTQSIGSFTCIICCMNRNIQWSHCIMSTMTTCFRNHIVFVEWYPSCILYRIIDIYTHILRRNPPLPFYIHITSCFFCDMITSCRNSIRSGIVREWCTIQRLRSTKCNCIRDCKRLYTYIVFMTIFLTI